ncbi:MAG: integration host factor subunit beta [Desulfobacula sp.]|nr:integration host factor subunit beta [Desulfobacula sp.]
MNKLKLIDMLKDRCSLTQNEAMNVVNLFFSQMANALAKGDRVELRGLWSFHLKDYKSYTGRNPKTGKIVRVAPKKLPFFKCGKDLKARVDFPPN